MIFRDDNHEKDYDTLLQKMNAGSGDVYRQALPSRLLCLPLIFSPGIWIGVMMIEV